MWMVQSEVMELQRRAFIFYWEQSAFSHQTGTSSSHGVNPACQTVSPGENMGAVEALIRDECSPNQSCCGTHRV